MSERIIVLQTPSTCDRYALPALGTVTLGSDRSRSIVVDAELAPHHATLYLDEGVAIELHDDDASLARSTDDDFRPLAKGKTVELSSGDRVRLGAAELVLVEVQPVAPRARVLPKPALERWLATRLADATRTSDWVVRLRLVQPVTAGQLQAAVASALRPGDVLAPLSALDYAGLLADVTPAVARRTLGELARALHAAELSVGMADSHEVEPGKVLMLATERLAPLPASDEASTWISDDPDMRAVDQLVNRAAAGMAHVLLMGETGVGKDIYAQLVHERSSRSGGPFVRVSCVELSETFADDDAASLLARARGGTLHIDEVTGLSVRAQLGLGYALDEAERAGLDVRFIASSNHDLQAAVAAGQLRKDLYYRLDQLQIVVPPLRQRRGDIMPLAELFWRQSTRGRGARVSFALSDKARAALEEYSWPGNVRELKNCIEHAVLLAGDRPIALEHLPRPLRGARAPEATAAEAARPPSRAMATPTLELDAPEAPMSLRTEIAALEKKRILEALRKYPTQREAAEALEMPMRTFLNRLDALGIPRARGGGGGRPGANDETSD